MLKPSTLHLLRAGKKAFFKNPNISTENLQTAERKNYF